MNKDLTIFEGKELEVLTKEDVNFDFDGTVLFNGKQSGEIMEYVRPTKAISDNVRNNQKYTVKNSDILKQDFRKLNNAGEIFVTEKGIMKLIINSNMPKAEEFEDKIWEIVTKIQQTGKYDSIEEKIKLIEDQKERKLTMSLYGLEQVLKVNPNDMLTVINYNQTKTELDNYKQKKQLEEVKKSFNELEGKIKKTTVLREGDMDSKAVARKFNIFSKTDKPHNQFADKLAKVLGFYQNPRGNAGYQDDYISINLSSVGGTTVSEIKYSQEAVNLMEEYINTNGLEIEEPPKYGLKGKNKGRFQQATMIFENGEHIFVNEITYKFYSQIVNKGE